VGDKRNADRRDRLGDAIRYCARREHLRRTIRIALVVGLVLIAINQLDVILAGDATTSTWIKSATNFLVPFLVANLGLLSGRRLTSVDRPAGRGLGARG
jgi:hypothetical protein